MWHEFLNCLTFAKHQQSSVGQLDTADYPCFYTFLLPYYVKTQKVMPNRAMLEIVKGFALGNSDCAMRNMQTFFAGIDYKMKIENKNNFHNAFYLLTHILGLDTET